MVEVRSPRFTIDSVNEESIAIIGVSCRLPGGANTPEQYWQLLEDKVDAIEDIPADRWDVDAYYSPEKDETGKMYTRQGGFLKDIDKFDNNFFRISPVEAESLDPQVRLLLELSYEALENAGQDAKALRGSATSVFMGLTIVDYIEKDIRSANPHAINAYSVTGTQTSSASGRISFYYGFEGPSLSLDTACSSSLVTVHLACQSLLAGESTLAMAGGVNLILSPKYHISFCRLGGLSADCRSKAFDASGDGFVRSEGGGIVLLKRYADAVRDGDTILALIDGSAVTNDGIGKGYTVPNPAAQEKALRLAMQKAKVGPNDIDYYEAHGTGTPVGDPLEMQGIANAFRERTTAAKLVVGSVKTNIGHCESAAGVAGLIKVVLSLNKQKIPANLHFNTPHPKIDWLATPVVVPTEAVDWQPGPKPRYAATSSFGLSGTNAAVILREKPAAWLPAVADGEEAGNQRFVLPVAASSTSALEELLQEHHRLLAASAATTSAYCAAAALQRTGLPVRAAVTGRTQQELLSGLQDARSHKHYVTNDDSAKKIVFVFPGQGSQWLGMGRELLAQEPVFRQALEACDAAIGCFTDWSLLAELAKGEENSRFQEVNVIQPTLFALEIALARLWQAWGIQPDVVIGHSMGETAAAYIAGALSLQDAAAVICKRSLLARTLSGGGVMALTELSMTEAEEAILGLEDQLSIAACNAPRSTVLSGDPAAMQRLLGQLAEQGVFNRLIKVDFASHSPQMDALKPQLLTQLAGLSPRQGTTPIYSTVTNCLTDGSNFDAQYWADNLRNPVLFSQGIQALLAEDNVLFVEVSPHPILVQLMQQNIEHLRKTASTAIHSLKREQDEQLELLNGLGFLYANGAAVRWQDFYQQPVAPNVVLPRYPWQRERFWLDTAAVGGYIGGYKTTKHPLLGRLLRFATHKDQFCWECEISTTLFPYLLEHSVNDTVIFPAAGYIELALAAARETFGVGNHQLYQVEYKQPLTLGEGARLVHLVFTSERENTFSFTIHSVAASQAATGAQEWEAHCHGVARTFGAAPPAQDSPLDVTPQHLATYPVQSLKEAHYHRMRSVGITYGPRFQGVAEIWANATCAIGKIMPEATQQLATGYLLHPAVLDACFQLSLAALLGAGTEMKETYLPAGIAHIWIMPEADFAGPLWVKVLHADQVPHDEGSYTKDITIYNALGQRLAQVDGFKFKRLAGREADAVAACFYKVQWQPVPAPVVTHPASLPPGTAWLLLGSPAGVGGQVAAQLRAMGGRPIYVQAGDDFAVAAPAEEPASYTVRADRASDYTRLLKEVSATAVLTEIVYLWGLEKTGTLADLPEIPATESFQAMPFIALLQGLQQAALATSPRLTIITSGTQQVGSAPEQINIFQAPLWGVGRVAFHELREYNCTRIDLSYAPSREEGEALVACLLSEPAEQEYALRGGTRYVPRLLPAPLAAPLLPASPQPRRLAGDTPFRFMTSEPGLFENITVREVAQTLIQPDEIKVAVHAVGLNFLNVMSALGIYPGLPNGFLCLGLEFAGEVRQVGKDVHTLKPGDRVMGLSPRHDCMGRYTVCQAAQAIAIPQAIDYASAASIPIAFGTAYIALVTYGNLRKGERVLIHSASGGVGLAAIQIAQQAGAEIYATAGSEQKRALLRQMGVPYVMDSRSLDFAQQIREYTHGEGIDVVLNTLTDEAMYESMKLLRSFGRFLEIGKKDIYSNTKIGLDIFKESISYTFFDLYKMALERPQVVQQVMADVLAHFARGEYQPIAKTIVPASRLLDGFTKMAKGEHTGKIVFDLQDPELLIEPAKPLFASEETYLITGGLGGLGWELAQWMCRQGARCLVLVGRSQPADSIRPQLAALEASGCRLLVEQGDISRLEVVETLLAKIRRTLPPLRGVFHAAGLLDDCSLTKMDAAGFARPLLPKIQGAWNLHRATQADELRYFVLFSSIASLFGSVGQGNYVAGNTFLDALARFRVAQHLPVNCLNWGPVAQIGLAAADAMRGQRLAGEGIASLQATEYLEAVELALRKQLNEVAIMRYHHESWLEANPSYAQDHLLDGLGNQKQETEASSTVSQFKVQLFGMLSLEDATQLMTSKLQEILGAILKTNPSRLDPDIPFASLGVDSLMAIQLRNRLEKLLGFTVSVTLFWNYPRIRLLAAYLLEEVGATAHFTLAASASGATAMPVEQALDELSDEQLFADLDKELDELSY